MCFFVKGFLVRFVDDMERLLPKWFWTPNMTMEQQIDKDLRQLKLP